MLSNILRFRALQAPPMMFLPPHPTLSMPPHMASSPVLMAHMSPNSPLVHSSSQPSTLSSLPLRPAYNVAPSSNPTSVPHSSRRALGAVIREAKDGTLTILSSTAIPTAVAVSKVSTVSHSHDLPAASRAVSYPSSTMDLDGTATNRVDEAGMLEFLFNAFVLSNANLKAYSSFRRQRFAFNGAHAAKGRLLATTLATSYASPNGVC